MLVQRQLKDPRLGFVTVTEVDTSPDLKHAKVYVSVLGPEDQWASSFKALESARGFVWSWLRRHLDLRTTPELLFRPDRSMEHAAHIQTLLADLRAKGPAAPEDGRERPGPARPHGGRGAAPRAAARRSPPAARRGPDAGPRPSRRRRARHAAGARPRDGGGRLARELRGARSGARGARLHPRRRPLAGVADRAAALRHHRAHRLPERRAHRGAPGRGARSGQPGAQHRPPPGQSPLRDDQLDRPDRGRHRRDRSTTCWSRSGGRSDPRPRWASTPRSTPTPARSATPTPPRAPSGSRPRSPRREPSPRSSPTGCISGARRTRSRCWGACSGAWR